MIKTATTKNTAASEKNLADWLLGNRLLADVGALSSDKTKTLDDNCPGWHTPVSDDEAARALMVQDDFLNSAFTLWWNAQRLSAKPFTYNEIRDKAVADGALAG